MWGMIGSGAAQRHLAFHCVHDPVDVLENGFCVLDGRLSVQRLLRFDLRGARLARCSACSETAKRDAAPLDRTVCLAVAVLFAQA